MNTETILNELRQQRDRITQAIQALEGMERRNRGRQPGRHMSADARARISAAMKKRWAARKANPADKVREMRKRANA